MRALATAVLALTLSACSGGLVPPSFEREPPRAHPSANVPVRQPTPAVPLSAAPAPPVPAGAARAAVAGLVPGPDIASLPITRQSAERALAAFRLSCPALQRRADASGLTRGEDWAEACRAAEGWPARDAADFFARHFEAVQVADGRAFATGYYEPEIAGSRERRPGYDVPIYAKPGDLIEVDLGLFSENLKGKRIRGRVQGSGFVPISTAPRSSRARSTGACR